jgi:transcriptional regulator
MAVNGADAYVSPDWYASPDQVPTWLYQSVHLTGTVRQLSDSELAAHLDALSAKFESRLAPKTPWTSSKMTAGRLDAMKKAIVGLVMSVDEVEGSFKLNQHKSDIDHVAVTTALARQPEAAAQHLASEMRVLRPPLFESQTTPSNAKAANAKAAPEGAM